MAQIRTLDTMMKLFSQAKLDASLSASVRPVLFTDNLNSDQYKLFEVDSALADAMSNSEATKVIELKDEPGKLSTGRVYACTTEQTYSVVETETSNTLLLIPNSCVLNNASSTDEKHLPAVVEALKTSYFELHPCIAPSLRSLKQKMLPSKYYGPVEDDYEESQENCASQTPPSGITRSELSAEFPCSPNELVHALSRLRIFEIKGFMRLVEPDYLIQIIRDIFSCADEYAWDWRQHGFSVKNLLECLKSQHCPSVVKQIISLYFYPRTTATCTSSTDLAVFPRSSKICQLIGEQLLSVTNSFDLKDFKAVWKATVPSGLRPKLRKHLTCAGRAFCGTGGSSLGIGSGPRERNSDRSHSLFRTISLLRSEDLPDDSVESRLHALFERCRAWPELELASYFTDLLVPPDTTCKLYSDATVGPLRFPSGESTDSDFEYCNDLEDEFTESASAEESDTPKPAPASIGTVLTRLCRVTTGADQGRIYTQKYALT